VILALVIASTLAVAVACGMDYLDQNGK